VRLMGCKRGLLSYSAGGFALILSRSDRQMLPIDDHKKSKLLRTRSPKLLLRLISFWIEKLAEQCECIIT